MKKILSALLALGALSVSSLQAQLNVATVSMEELFDSYYKRTQIQTGFDSVQAGLRAQAEERAVEVREREEALRALQEELQSPVLSDDAKAAKENELRAGVEAYQRLRQETEQWVQQKQRELAQRYVEERDKLIEEIRQVVTRVATAQGADLVLDTSRASQNNVPAVVYAEASLDITQRVLTELNNDAPASAPAPAQ